MKKEKILNLCIAVVIGVLIYSVISLNEIEKIKKETLNYEEKHKIKIGQIYDQDYWKFSNVVSLNTSGEYYNKTGNIIIYTKNRSIESVLTTCIHESMHYYWAWNLLDGEVKEKYIEIYENTNTYISNHAKRNVFEDFAESYVCFKSKKCVLDKKRLDFMNTYVKTIS